ncbi:MAG TPA: hypothetical protein VH196_05615 [Terriglobales bacterium]|jgi:hypothetical protein|nr:hypothetical protein [Terriglobales bacterium]
MNPGRKTVRYALRAGDAVPESGVYEVIHRECSSDVRQAVFLAGEAFPGCRICGAKVRFQLKQAVPHISEDRDFKK